MPLLKIITSSDPAQRRRRRILREQRERVKTAEDTPSVFERILAPIEAADATLRGALLGRAGRATVEEFNQAEPVRQTYQQLGLDPEGGPARLLTSLVVSPFNFMGPIGGLTRAGQATAKLSNAAKTLRGANTIVDPALRKTTVEAARKIFRQSTEALKKAGKLGDKVEAETLLKAVEAGGQVDLPRLAATLAGQARAGERSLFQVGLPFTRFRAQVPIAGGRLASQLGLGAAGLAGRPLQPLGRLFRRSSRAPGIPPTEELRELGERLDFFEEFALPAARQEGRVIEQLLRPEFRRLAGTPGGIRRALRPAEFLELERVTGLRGRDLIESLAPIERALGEAATPEGIERLAREAAENAPIALSGSRARFSARGVQVPRVERGREAARRLIERGVPTQGEIDMARELAQKTLDGTVTQFQSGARSPSSFLRSEFVDYAMRTLSREAKQILDARGLTDDAQAVLARAFDRRRAATTFEATQIPRDPRWRNMATSELEQFIKEQVPQLRNVDVFDFDPIRMTAKAVELKQESTAIARLYSDLANRFSVPLTQSIDAVPLSEFLASRKLFRYKLPLGKEIQLARKGESLTRETIEEAFRRAGRPDLVERGIPRAVVRETVRRVDSMLNPQAGRILFPRFNKFLSSYRFLLTQPFPAFHFRNFFSNNVLMMMGGMRPHELPRYYRRVHKLLKATDDESKATLAEFIRARAVRGPEFIQALREDIAGAPASALGRHLGNIIGVGKGGRVRQLGAAASRVGEKVEDYSRAALYLWARDRGMTPAEAAVHVNRYLFDYSALSNFERNFAAPLFLFYRFTRNALPLMFEEAFRHPRRSAFLFKVATGEGLEKPQAAPEFVRRGPNIPLPPPLQRTAEGDIQVLFGAGFPQEELRLLSGAGQGIDVLFGQQPRTFSAAKEAFTESFNEVAGRLSPPIRQILELSFGRNFFFREPLDEIRKAPPVFRRLPEALQRAIGFEETETETGRKRFAMDAGIRFILDNLPTARVTSTLFKVDDPRRNNAILGVIGLEALAQLFTGLKITSFDEQQEVLRRARRAAERRLRAARSTGEVRLFERPFIPSDVRDRGAVSDDVLASQAMLQAIPVLQRELRRRRRREGRA